VKTNVGKEFLQHKLFNRQTVKISYKCMPNMAQAVARHNVKVLKEDQRVEEQPGCNCEGGQASCPVQGSFKTKVVVYETAITETVSGKKETYCGLTCR
jgi:hypothetical protein